jgi:Carboxypeptidase regulatory-like domain
MKSLFAAISLTLAFQGGAVRPASVQGTVVRSSNSDPVEAAGVELWRVGAASSSYIVTTTSRGEFLFKDVNPGEYHLAATHTGYVRSEYGHRGRNGPGLIISVGDGQQIKDLSITLTETGAIYGRVYDRAGMVLPNVQVQALKYSYQPSGRRTLDTVKAAITNDLGEYRLFWLPPGQYYVSATPFPGSMPETVVFPAGDGGALTRVIRPSAGALIEVSDQTSGSPFYFPGTVDARLAEAIELRPGDSRGGVDIRVDARNTHRVKGLVTNRPTAQGERVFSQIQILPRGTALYPAIIPGGTVDPNTGAFEIRNVPPGEYYLRISVTFPSGSNRPFLFGQVPIGVFEQDIENLSVRLEPGSSIPVHVSIEGQPADSPDLKRLRVYICGQADPSPQQLGLFIDSNVPPGDCRLNIINLPRGGYIKSARMGTVDVLADGVSISGTEDPRPIEVVISTQGAALEGVVLNDRREHLSNVTVVVIPETSKRRRPELYKVGFTDAVGQFRVSGIAPGDYSVFAWDDVETSAWLDPDFVRPYENQAARIHAAEGGKQTLEIPILSLKQ